MAKSRMLLPAVSVAVLGPVAGVVGGLDFSWWIRGPLLFAAVGAGVWAVLTSIQTEDEVERLERAVDEAVTRPLRLCLEAAFTQARSRGLVDMSWSVAAIDDDGRLLFECSDATFPSSLLEKVISEELQSADVPTRMHGDSGRVSFTKRSVLGYKFKVAGDRETWHAKLVVAAVPAPLELMDVMQQVRTALNSAQASECLAELRGSARGRGRRAGTTTQLTSLVGG